MIWGAVRRVGVLVAALVVAAASAALACEDAAGWSERTVCQYQELRDDDVRVRGELSHLLRLVSSGDRQRLRAEQNAWDLRRDLCRADAKPVSCLRERYRERLAELDRSVGRETEALRSNRKGEPGLASGPVRSLARLPRSSLDR